MQSELNGGKIMIDIYIIIILINDRALLRKAFKKYLYLIYKEI